jgi:hypothetical protein
MIPLYLDFILVKNLLTSSEVGIPDWAPNLSVESAEAAQARSKDSEIDLPDA